MVPEQKNVQLLRGDAGSDQVRGETLCTASLPRTIHQARDLKEFGIHNESWFFQKIGRQHGYVYANLLRA